MFYDKEKESRGGRHNHERSGEARRGGKGGLHSNRKLSSAELQLLLLLLLSQNSLHGYEVIKTFEERTDGFYVPSPGMVYPALTFLEEIGLALVEVEGTKKRYRITDAGRSYLEANRENAENLLAELERIGAQMANARRAFAEDADEAIEHEELENARRALRRAVREREPFAGEEAERVAEILNRATADVIGDSPAQKIAKLGENPLYDAPMRRVLTRLLEARPRPPRRELRERKTAGLDAFAHKNFGFNIRPEQGELIYLLCRASGARRVGEFGTSLGFSLVYLAAAIRDNGGEVAIGSELVPEKVKAARRNLADAGLENWAQIREGDARQRLQNLGAPLDFFLLDGWPVDEGPSLAREVIEIVAPQLRVGALVLNDNSESDYLEWIRDPQNGFLSMPLPFRRTFELSVKTR